MNSTVGSKIKLKWFGFANAMYCREYIQTWNILTVDTHTRARATLLVNHLVRLPLNLPPNRFGGKWEIVCCTVRMILVVIMVSTISGSWKCKHLELVSASKRELGMIFNLKTKFQKQVRYLCAIKCNHCNDFDDADNDRVEPVVWNGILIIDWIGQAVCLKMLLTFKFCV